MSTLTPPAPQRPHAPTVTNPLDRWWPDAGRGRPLLVMLCVAVGALAALVLPSYEPGIGWTLVWLAVCGVVTTARGLALPRSRWADLALVAALVAMVVVRDAEWVVVLCLLAALALTAISSTAARTVTGMVLSGMAVPLAGLRGLPWLGRSLRPGHGETPWWPVVRTTGVSVVLLVVFGALFASADAVFADWIDAVTPDLTLPELPGRLVLGTFIAGGTLAAAYVALTRPDVDGVRRPPRRSATRSEWLVPLLVVDVVFAAFLVAQATVLFGGHDYLRRTTGLTYAEYVHQGFGELTVATVLTLMLLSWVGHRAGPGRNEHRAGPGRNEDRAAPGVDRALAAGALGVMTLVVVASALHRMGVYMDAYGFTRLRLLVAVFEGWLGVVVLLVLVGGLVGGRWIAATAVRLGAAALLGLALLNPDAWIAEHNLGRDTSTTPIDYAYLGGLSADAYPVFSELSPTEFSCVTSGFGQDVDADEPLGWNLGRSRALDLQSERPPAPDGQPCRAASSGSSDPK